MLALNLVFCVIGAMTSTEAAFINPFRHDAGHAPPYLAGRTAEQDAFFAIVRGSTEYH